MSTNLIDRSFKPQPLWVALMKYANTRSDVTTYFTETPSATYDQSLAKKHLLSDAISRAAFGWVNNGTLRFYAYIDKNFYDVLFADKESVETDIGVIIWDRGNVGKTMSRLHKDTVYVDDGQALKWFIDTWLSIDVALTNRKYER